MIAPADIASLAVFRILFGTLMAGAMVRYLAKGWVHEFFLRPTFFFPYEGFAWLRPLPGGWMHAVVILVALAAVGIAAGCFYRWSAPIFFAGFTYLELIDKTTYLNHYYLVSLLAGLLIFLPAHRAFSIDARRKPHIRADFIPVGVLKLLRFQVAVVYIFAGVAKLNADWLLRAQPMRIWLQTASDLPLLSGWLTEDWVAFAASWAGAIFDLSIVFFLLWRRSRPLAYLAVVLFHLVTACLFNIGLFPWLMMACAILFFPADFPRRRTPSLLPPPGDTRVKPAWLAAGVLYCAVQVFLPLRSAFSGVESAWSYFGFNFSWRVMVAEKRGAVELFARNGTSQREWRIAPSAYLTPRQEVIMAQDPWMIRALAGRIAADLEQGGHGRVAVRAEARVSLNGRPSRYLIDPRADLASPASTDDWILASQQTDW